MTNKIIAIKKVIKIKALIYEVEHERDDIIEVPQPPNFFEGDILACDDFRGLIDCLDETAILIGSLDNKGVELAIRVALFKKIFKSILNLIGMESLYPRSETNSG